MFNKPSGTGFNFGTASTPTSTPMQSNNNNMPQKAPLFGNSNPGVSTPSPAGGLFGNSSSNNSNSTFGAKSSNLFGNNTQGQSGLFGSSSTNQNNTQGGTGLFGNSSAQPQNTNTSTGGLFGNKPSTGLFGSNANTSTLGSTGLGASKPTTGLFGSSQTTNQPQTSLFGNSNTAQPGGLFNNNGTANTTGLFGKPQASGLFGSNTTNTQSNPPSSNPYGFNVSMNPTPITTMPESITASSKKELHNASDKGLAHAGRSVSMSISNPNATPINQSSLISKLSTRINSSQSNNSLQGLFSPSNAQTWFGNLKSTNLRSKNSFSDNYQNGSNQVVTNGKLKGIGLLSQQKEDLTELRRLKIDNSRSAAKKLRLLSGSSTITKAYSNEIENNHKPSITEPHNFTNQQNDVTDVEKKCEELNNESDSKLSNEQKDYWCSPSPDQLREYTDDQLAAVSNFVIGRKNHGYITYADSVDLRDFAKDFEYELFHKVVIFRSTKTVEVYPDETQKPANGYGLNVPAIITLEHVYPVDKKTKKPITDSSRLVEFQLFSKKLRALRDMEFISYNPFNGIWTFKVQHFSIWGLVNEDDAEIDEDDLDEKKKEKEESEKELLFHDRSKVEKSLAFVDDLIDEKAYEPEVKDEDFDGLEAAQILETANNWDDQLRVAGLPTRSIFADSVENTSNEIDLLFQHYEKERNLENTISKERRFTNSMYTFARFGNKSSLVIKNKSSNTGVKLSNLKTNKLISVLTNKKIFENELSTSFIESRHSNSYPKVIRKQIFFNDIANTLGSNDREFKLWSLSSILFDPIYIDTADESKEIILKYTRKEKIAKWIINETQEKINDKINKKSDPLEKIFLYLLINNITQAAKLALKSGNGHLSVLISMLGSNDPRLKELADMQLVQWSNTGGSIDINVAYIYKLLSGNPFTGSFSLTEIMKDFDWLVSLGVSLYYGEIDEYSLEKFVSKTLGLLPDDEDSIFPIIFRLFCSGNQIQSFLEDIQIRTNFLSSQYLWYCVQILSNNNATSFDIEFSDKLSLAYSENLELTGHIPESLYVASHINDDGLSKRKIDDLVFRNIEALTSSKKPINFLSKLCLPESLIYRAMALFAKYNKNYIEQLNNLLCANNYDEAKKVFINYVSPQFILKRNPESLAELSLIISQFPINELKGSDMHLFELYANYRNRNSTNVSDLKALALELPIFYERNKGSINVSACCTVISNDIVNIILSRDPEEIKELRPLIVKLPMGQSEKIYTTKHLSKY
ncbi:Uncharacterized protein RNJ44_03166 [Nakaseomyces bracarensis]|uniref:Peptidase S59 domain-containing protein n=1 Tax=Nakaseomyces bracarensis TaxID=273131 RepID=A0ABR4NZ11_9SACH